MAIDQSMLEFTDRTGQVVLRFYEWLVPTVSLGYFQSLSQRHDHTESKALEIVRRATGGGAIVHHYDWTYSVSVPGRLLFNYSDQKRSRQDIGASPHLYNALHDSIVEWLQREGVPAQKWASNGAPEKLPSDTCRCAFLCFERRALGDVVVGQHKVLGSAQRRLGGSILQHGSILISRSTFAPSLVGLTELGVATSLENLKEGFTQSIRIGFEQAFAVSLPQVDSVFQALGLEKHELSKSKFHRPEWLNSR